MRRPILAVVTALLALCACGRDAGIRREAQRVLELTIPPDATMPYLSSLTRSDWKIEGSWEFETKWDWPRYAEWVADRLPPTFERIQTVDDSLVFVRLLNGDTHAVRLQVVQEGPPLRIRGTFTARPS